MVFFFKPTRQSFLDTRNPNITVNDGAITSGSANQHLTTRTYDNFIFELPEGWNAQQNENFLEIVPQNVRNGEIFSIILMKGKESQASLEEELASGWNEFADMLGAQKLQQVSGGYFNSDEISKTMAGWEYVAGHGSVRTGADFFMHFYVIRASGRIERVIVLAKEISLDPIRNNIDPTIHHYPYYVAITNFIFSLRFANLPKANLPPALWKGKEVLGIWSGLGFKGGGLKTTYVIFFSNGQVFYGDPFPIQGLYDLNTYAEKERSPTNWGTYKYQNEKGTITMLNGSFPFRLQGDILVMKPIDEEHVYIRMGVIDEIKLTGTWLIEDENSTKVSLQFNSDGSFVDNGALRVLDHTLYQYYSIADGGGKGNYFVNDYSIIFNYDDGRILRIAFPGMGYSDRGR